MALGNVYSHLGNKQIAMSFYQKSLSISEKEIGKNNIWNSTIIGNMGNVYKDLGDLEKAKECFE